MKHWRRSKRDKASGGASPEGLELLVLEGADTGQRFSVDAEQTVIGRQLTEDERPGGILLHDTTVSSRQAMIRRDGGQYVIHHLAQATNPTLLNGIAVRTGVLVPGSKIQLGHILIEVRRNQGTALHVFTQRYSPLRHSKGAKEADPAFATEILDLPTAALDLSDMSHPPQPTSEIGWLEFKEDKARRHPIRRGQTSIGRSAQCDIRVDDLGVSREHVQLVWEGKHLVLYHKSTTNLTLVNRYEVTHRMILCDGDEITLAGQVTLSVRIDPAFRVDAMPDGESPDDARQLSGLHAAMEHKVALERHIAEEFSVEGSFFDLDVVNSLGMKTQVSEPERIILSFERFRAFVTRVVSENHGHVLNSNGDELMCFFAACHDAVHAGAEVFAQLPEFNRLENLLDDPFRFRIGIHTGQSLVDLKRGIAYSTTLDVAGHLQKLAPTNQMALSQQTVKSLPPGLSFHRAGTLEREGFDYYLIDGTSD